MNLFRAGLMGWALLFSACGGPKHQTGPVEGQEEASYYVEPLQLDSVENGKIDPALQESVERIFYVRACLKDIVHALPVAEVHFRIDGINGPEKRSDARTNAQGCL